jgi:hypothetical protein
MMLGLDLSTFTTVHVVISLIAIAAGLIVMFSMLDANKLPALTAIFLLFTILTSVTGFGFPFDQLLPSHMIGILSLVLLLIACVTLYGTKLGGAWRWIYVITALVSLYLNVFVLIVQGFLKIPALHALAPGNPPNGPTFAVVQGIVLLLFVALIVGAIRRFHPK